MKKASSCRIISRRNTKQGIEHRDTHKKTKAANGIKNINRYQYVIIQIK